MDNDEVRKAIPKAVFMESFLLSILNANIKSGKSILILINQIGKPVKVFTNIDTPVNPPGAISCGLKNILIETDISKQPISNINTSLIFNFEFFTETPPKVLKFYYLLYISTISALFLLFLIIII